MLSPADKKPKTDSGDDEPQINGHIDDDVSMEESADDPEVGSSFKVMKLWEGRSSQDQLIWLTEPPEVKVEKKPRWESAEYAITLQHKTAKGTKKQILDTIVMRGPELRKFLENTIPNVNYYYNEVEHGIAIRTPFRQLFWHFDQIEEATKAQDPKLSEAATLLQGVLNEEFQDLLHTREKMVSQHEINFDVLWTLFKPGKGCLTDHIENYKVAVKVSSIEFSRDPSGKNFYRIKHDRLGWDGEYLGWQDSYTDIMEFSGRRRIQDLDIFPFEFNRESEIIDQLVSRGKRFVEIAVKEPHMMTFSGATLDREASPMWWQGEQKKMMSGRLILDARAYSHYHRRLYVTKFIKRSEANELLTDENTDPSIYMYCCPELHTFALQRKRWVRIWIDDLHEVTFNELAYPSLVLPGDYKQLLLAFAEAQIDGYGFDDVIAGKGQGILMLLAGPPGTGKTLTAEAVAEHMRRPLYSVAAGELGASAGGMEAELDRVLELSTRWNAVLLIDEADVFLEKRADNDLQRNTIVSVFLRKLEYYRGIMFLTTNRHGSFDEAFKSRIHISIQYPDLDVSARHAIWTNFLKKAAEIYGYGVEVNMDDIDQLAQKVLNGREIRNIVKSAQLLASRTKQPLGKKHLDIVWNVEHKDSVWRQFDNDGEH